MNGWDVIDAELNRLHSAMAEALQSMLVSDEKHRMFLKDRIVNISIKLSDLYKIIDDNIR